MEDFAGKYVNMSFLELPDVGIIFSLTHNQRLSIIFVIENNFLLFLSKPYFSVLGRSYSVTCSVTKYS